MATSRQSSRSATGAAAPRPPSLSFAETAPSDVRRTADEIRDRFSRAVDAVKRNGGTAGAFAILSDGFGEASESSVRATLPSLVHADADVRAASHAAKDELKNMFDGALSDGDLYRSLLLLSSDREGCEANGGDDDDDGDDDAEDKLFRHNILNALRRNGCGLESESARSEVRSKRRRIEETCTAFCSAINENDDALLFSDGELEGVDDVERFPVDDATGKRRVTLKAPDVMPVLQFASDPSVRRRASEALAKKCQAENAPRLSEVLRLRHECATALGYDSHAHYMLETKMAATPECAQEFLRELADSFQPIRRREADALVEMKRQDVGEGAVLEPWDVLYYTRLYKAKHAGVDEAELKRYFPLEHVKAEIFSIYEEFLSLRFERVVDADVWNDDVECYAVRSAPSSNGDRCDVLGHFFLDLYPRKGKYSHQCVYPLRPSYVPSRGGGGRVLPACVNIGNLTPSRDGVPSMLRFGEVVTFFHEFGHVCHCVLTNSKHSLHSWAWSAVPWPGGVEQDFLEVPSMMLENFVWQPEILRRLSKHETDGSSLPEPSIEALSKSRFLMNGYRQCKYLAMALYDMKVHGGPGPYEFEGEHYDAVSLYTVLTEQFTGVPAIPGTFPAASWFHLMMGYDAGYYGYIYSETFAADLFGEFEQLQSDDKSILDRSLGKRYRDLILSPCATVDGDKMLRNFLGRAPSKTAFLNRIPTADLLPRPSTLLSRQRV